MTRDEPQKKPPKKPTKPKGIRPFKKGVENVKFGRTGHPLVVDSKLAARARAGKIKLIEDGGFLPKPKKNQR